MQPDETMKLLQVENLRVHYRSGRGTVRAVDGASFSLGRNEALAILGESGCGKSSLARGLLRLVPGNIETCSGEVKLAGDDISSLKEDEFRRRIRWTRISLVMQAAMNALNPVMRVGLQAAEPLQSQLGWPGNEALRRAARVFRMVGIPADFLDRYPFELSGGMRQRAVLAMALMTEPDVVILDEPTSALDVLTQGNIMNVLKRIKAETKTGFIMITHDISTSSEIADRVALMYAGEIVELSAAGQFFPHPAHPYSKALLASVSRVHQVARPRHIPGRPPNLIEPPPGCRFADRCPNRFERCSSPPGMFRISRDQSARCWLYEQGHGVSEEPGG